MNKTITQLITNRIGFSFSIHQVLAAVLTIVAMAVGQTAMAARKAVTYTITSIELNSSTNNYDIVFTRSGDAPFVASVTTYTTSVQKNSIGGESSGNPGQIHVELADGFELLASWQSGSNVTFTNNCIAPGVSGKQITYAVSWTNNSYYVTHITMQGMEFTWDDTTYDFRQSFAHSTSTAYSFGSLTITYYDAIPEAIGSIQYNRSLEAYEINCAQHLQDLSEYVNGEYGHDGNNTVVVKEPHKCAGLTFLQTADIDFEPKSAWNDYDSDEHNLFAIGCEKMKQDKTYYNYFSGTYNGQNHTISGIRIYSNSNDGRAIAGKKGLFGYVEEGTVQNVTIANARIVGHSDTGGIVGYNDKSAVSNCHAAHDVAIRAKKGASSVGGIVGMNNHSSNVTGCTSAAVITAIDATECQYFGGIAGSNSSGCTVSGCTAAGVILPSYGAVDYTGAIVGKSEGTLSGNTYHSSLVGTFAFNIGAGRGYVAGTTLDNSKLFLYDDRDNTTLINAYVNSSTAYGGTAPTANYLAVTLKGRTLYKDGTWNTLCLPFTITGTNSLPNNLKTDVSVMELDNSTNGGTAFDATKGTLTLNFKTVGTSTEITKGKPYIIKWTSGEDIADPTFNYVYRTSMTASTTTVKSSDNYVTFRGTYDPVAFSANDRTKLFLGSANTLYYPSADVTVNAFRAYFQLNGITAGKPSSEAGEGVRAFVLNFGDDEASGITTTNYTNLTNYSDGWYTLDGRKLYKQPTKSGLYIYGNRKVVIK